MRCVIHSYDSSKKVTKILPEHTTIEKLCESAVPRRWYRPNNIIGLQRPFDHEQIPWHTDSIPAVTSSGQSNYDFNNLKINKDEPIIEFFSRVLNSCTFSKYNTFSGNFHMKLRSSRTYSPFCLSPGKRSSRSFGPFSVNS